MTWTEVAQHAGYYDQMHMIREFRSLGGAIPTALTHQLEPHHGMSLLLDTEHRGVMKQQRLTYDR